MVRDHRGASCEVARTDDLECAEHNRTFEVAAALMAKRVGVVKYAARGSRVDRDSSGVDQVRAVDLVPQPPGICSPAAHMSLYSTPVHAEHQFSVCRTTPLTGRQVVGDQGWVADAQVDE